jgi:NAD(P)H-dependent flavin oxidoreductase YrpB (nitropropane dioxygenase family)
LAQDPLRTSLCELLGSEVPIVSFTRCKEVAVAVTNAGGFAVLGESQQRPERIAADIAWVRERVGARGFGVDLVQPVVFAGNESPEQLRAQIPEEHLAYVETIRAKYDVPKPNYTKNNGFEFPPNRRTSAEQLAVALAEGVRLIVANPADPGRLVAAAHERNQLVFGVVDEADQAKPLLEAGVDGLVARGFDAAGPTGLMGTFSFVPEIAALAGATPVLAAGGITTGRHLAAALCLGAAGVWTGTVWLAADESDLDPALKQRLIEASAEDTDYSPALSGRPMRVLSCPWTQEWGAAEAPRSLAAPYQAVLGADYIRAGNQAGRADLMTEAVGQGVGFVTESKPAGRIVAEMVAEARSAFATLTGEVQ